MHLRFLSVICYLLLGIAAASVSWAEEPIATEQSNPPAAETDRPGPELAARSGSQGDRATDSEEASEEIPEIEVEVIGKKWGEQSVPSLAPSTGEVISVIPAEEIKAAGESTVADTIQFLPGVQIVRQGRKFERLIYVRGTSVPTVLLDGAQISAATSGFMEGFSNRALYSIPLSAVERIEVIRSSSSLIYGPQVLTGGVINIVTKSGRGPSQFDLRTEGGSYSNLRYSVGHFEGDERRGSALVAEQETGDSNLEWGARRMSHLFYKADRKLENGDTFKLFFLSNEGRRQVDSWSQEYQQIAKVPPVYWTFDPWRERFTSLAYAHNLRSPGAGIDVLFWARNRYFHQRLFDGPISPKANQTVYQDTKDDTVGLSLFWRQPVSTSHFLRMGMQWFQLNGYDQDVVLDPGSMTPVEGPPMSTDSKLTSYIFQDEWTLSPGTRLFYGARHERPVDRDSATIYSLGLERDLGEKAKCYARFGTGVEFPSESQLQTSPDLLDRTSQNLDVGLDRYLSPNLIAHLGWFRSAVQNDFIDYLKPGGDPSKRTDYLTTQADQTTSGFEVELQGRASKLMWFANWTGQDRSVGRTPMIGDQPLQLSMPPDNMINVGLRWSPDQDRTRLGLTFRYVSDYGAWARYFPGIWPMDAYQVANLTVSRDLGNGWSLSAGLNNMVDEQYETQPGFPMPGRNYSIGLARKVYTE